MASGKQIAIKLPSAQSIQATHYPAQGDSLLLWLPSSKGWRNGYIPVAEGLAGYGYDVWAVDLHNSFNIDTGRSSIDEFDINELIGLFSVAQKQNFKEIFLIAESRGAILALRMAYAWQKQGGELLKGMLLTHPTLIKGKTNLGERPDYVEEALQSNLPIYLLQPEYTTKYARSGEIAKILAKGGSSIFVHSLRGVKGGFHVRSEDSLRQRDIETKGKLPGTYNFAIEMMRDIEPPALAQATSKKKKTKAFTQKHGELQLFDGDPTPPPLKLKDINGEEFDLAEIKDEVVLINFWATWCWSCVKEIPSMARLVDWMEGDPFRVVSVNIGEPPQRIRAFLQDREVNFAVLLDSESSTVRDWQVYAYPSNFLIDTTGRIRYAYRGSLEWDSPDIIQKIEDLLWDELD